MAETGIEPSVGSGRDSYANALAVLQWVHWFNHHRLMESLGYISPAEAEEM